MKKKELFFQKIYFILMYVPVSASEHMCAGARGDGVRSLGAWVIVSCWMWALGTEPQSSTRTTRPLSCQDISLVS